MNYEANIMKKELGKKTKIIKLSVFTAVILMMFFLAGLGKAQAAMQRLYISDNNRFLVKEDGTPFFWMGDTAWSLATISPVPNPENPGGVSDLELYLDDRARNGFTVIQVDADAYGATNPYGKRPFFNDNPATPNEAWWEHIDYIINEAEAKGIYVCLMSMWGAVHDGSTYFGGYMRFNLDATKAYNFGRWLGNRYKNKNNVIWSIAGEYHAINRYQIPITAAQKALFNQVANGIRDVGGTQIMTIHSGREFHSENWLDFAMIQSGHNPDNTAIGRLETYEEVGNFYNLAPTKPIFDAEMAYEKIPPNTTITPPVVRRKAYWSVFAGGLGITYGHSAIQTMLNPYESGPIPDWKNYLDAPGALQMKYLRSLIESFPDYLNRVPDQSLILSPDPDLAGPGHVQATRGLGGSFALVYIPNGAPVTVDMAKIAGSSADASWYNPQTGEYAAIGNFPNSGSREFDPPGVTAEGNDWVLVLKKVGDVAFQCFDEQDNDSDGKIDFGYGDGNDPGCTHPEDNQETVDPAHLNGLIGRWTMDDADIHNGIIFDRSGHNNHALTGYTTETAGALDQARFFDFFDPAEGSSGEAFGNMDNISIKDKGELDLTSGSYTITAWINPTTFGQISNGRIIDHGGGSPGSGGWSLLVDNETGLKRLRFSVKNGASSDGQYSGNNSIATGAWQHVAVTVNAKFLTFYVNGAPKGTKTLSINPGDRDGMVIIGSRGSGQRGFNGSIDDVRIYDRVLSQPEIQSLYNKDPEFLSADVNSDGNINIKDIQICIKAIVAPDSFTTPDQLNQLAKCQAVALPIDVVNIKDIQAIIQAIVNQS